MVNPNIYFWEKEIDSFKKNNDRVKKLFEDTALDKDKLWEKYNKEIEEELKRFTFNPEGDGSEYYDLFQDRQSVRADILWHAEALHLYQYLVILCQTWENQLVSFFNKEVERYYTLEKVLGYGDIIGLIKENMDESNIVGLSKITELRQLVNVIKHGEGKAAETLRKKRPDFFKPKESRFTSDTLKVFDSIYLDSAALNVNKEEFNNYHDAIEDFWNSMPERLYLDGKTPADYKENQWGNYF